MKLKHPAVQKTLSLAAAFVCRFWRASIDWRAVYADPTVDTVHPRFDGRYVYCGWHEVMLMPIILRAHRRMLALASEHGDGEIISRVMGHLGWGVVRGSTSRGAPSALLRFLRDDDRCPNFTPDGPRGPRRTFSAGPIFLASKLGLPIVCVGYGYSRPWRLRSWDKFAVPRPFSRGRAVFGPPLRVPPRLDRPALEAYRAWFERLLNWLTEEAEGWAESGRRREGELAMFAGQAVRGMHRAEYRPAVVLPDQLAADWAALNGRGPAAKVA